MKHLTDALQGDPREALLWECFRLLVQGVQNDPRFEEMRSLLHQGPVVDAYGDILLPATQDALRQESVSSDEEWETSSWP